MKISVVTVAYINSKVVIDLLNSIAKYNDIGDDLEVIIVDNSPDENRIEDAIKVADYKNYIYVKENNRGFGAGNNAGAKIASGKIIAMLNPDIVLVEPIFKKICEKFEDNNLALMGCRLLDNNLHPMRSFGQLLECRFSLFAYESLEYCNKFGYFDSNEFYIEGCNLIIRKSVFENIGGFDENIFMYAEELDLFSRLHDKFPNMKIGFFDDVKIVHLIGQSSAMDPLLLWTRVWTSEVYVCKKQHKSFKKITEDRYKANEIRCCIAQALHYPLVEAIAKNDMEICKHISENFIKVRGIE